jgi:hypothetical protein
VTLAVTDQGIGLPAWEAARVFDPFFRARSSVANAVRGSGIGLALVREYVRTMGGEVAVTSSPGRGSTFSFTLPRPVVVDLNASTGAADPAGSGLQAPAPSSGVWPAGTRSSGRGGPGGVPSPNGRPPSASRPCGVSHPDRSGPAGTMPVGLMSVWTS